MINKEQAEKYCKNYLNIENCDEAMSDLDNVWDCHHRKEIDENKSMQQLIEENLYYNRPARELIFLTHIEHAKLHGLNKSEETKQKIGNSRKGKTHSEETKQKMSEAEKGENNPMFGKHHSAETKKKMSAAHKGNKGATGLHWFNNGIIETFAKECPEGFMKGRLKKSAA